MTEQMNADRPLGIKVATVARRLDCHKDHVYRLIRDGYLDALPGPGIRIVTTESLERYVAAARSQAAS